jgi:protein-S-isoprenylcysteine O-methyltransferase Ste14
MRRARFMIALTAFVGILLTFAPAAFAHADGGRGWWGETTDQQVTSVMFATIVLFPVLIAVFSIIQWRLDKRKHAREDAVKAREASADWRGGW